MNTTQSATKGNIQLLATGNIGRLLWEYSLPAVVGMLVMSLYNVIDRIFIGQGVGTEAIAGLAITFPVMNIAAALGVLIGAGASARVSIFMGADNKPKAATVLGNSLTLIVINATIYISLMRIFIDDILIAFGASPASLPYAHDFMVYIMPGMLIMNIGFSLTNIMRASGYPVKAMISMMIGAGANLILAPIFIFALGLGIKGAAIATDLAMTLVTVYTIAHFCRKRHTLHFTRGSFRLRWPIVLDIVGIGAAPALVNAASCFINVIMNKTLYLHGGDSAVAAAGIFVTYTSLLCMVVVGLCQGMQPIVGYNYGAKLYHRLKRTYWTAVLWATGVVAVGAAFGLLFPHLIARAFTIDADLMRVTTDGFRLALLCFVVVGFQIVTTTFFQSIGKVGQSIFLSLTRQVLFLIPLLLIMPRLFKLPGIWCSFPISDLVATLVAAVMIYRQLRIIDKNV
ncbi:MAG: MATE family efflux transporter [Muribaculaceae bacterium]|nr:MATE family efflux transporter [Muribaculaceae bacterium]